METDDLSAVFAALADPTRRAILDRLGKGATAVQDLAKPFDLSAPAVTYHLRVLEEAGLIQRTRLAQWRPCALVPGALKDAAGWITDHGGKSKEKKKRKSKKKK